jgi:CRISPR-associated protein Csc3
MQDFAGYFVNRVFYETFRADKSALRGKQLNLLKSACEVIYRDETARDWAGRDADDADIESVEEASADAESA